MPADCPTEIVTDLLNALEEAGASGQSPFTLDTSGGVNLPLEGGEVHWRAWDGLTPFWQGYVRRALEEFAAAQAAALNTVRGNYPIAFSDLAPETLAAMLRDCEQARKDFPHPELDHTGQWFWDKRQTGTWPHWSPVALYLGDDGRIYQREAA